MKRMIVGVVLSALTVNLNAQEAEDTGLQLKSVSAQLGVFNGSSGISNSSDFQKLAPNSSFEKSDVSGFKIQNSFFGSSGPAFSMNIVLAKPENTNLSRLNTEFRFGISYQEIDVLNLGYDRIDEFRIDTLISSRSGNQVFVDSTYRQSYYLSYNQTNVMVDGDVTISTDPSKRFKFYGGIGFSLGFSAAASTDIIYSTTSNVNIIEDEESSFEFEIDGSSERFRNDGGLFGRVYLPLGLDFRIGKTKATAMKYHLFVESRPNLSFHKVPELGSVTLTSNVSSLGFRYDF